MKTYDTTMILWGFDKMFPGNRYVWADVNAKKSNPRIRKFCVGSVEIQSVPEQARRWHDGKRTLHIDIRESETARNPEAIQSSLYGYSLAETLVAAGAEGQGFIQRGSYDCSWELLRGESFSDGAMRIARMFFKMLNIRTEAPPSPLTLDQLLSFFVVYKETQVWTRCNEYIRYDDFLRKRAKLPHAPTGLLTRVL